MSFFWRWFSLGSEWGGSVELRDSLKFFLVLRFKIVLIRVGFLEEVVGIKRKGFYKGLGIGVY